MPAAGIGWQSCKPSVTVNKGEKYIMEANYIWKKTLKGKEENSTLSSAETSLSHDLECSHLLRSVTNSHGSERRRSSSSAPTPLLLPSLSSVRGAFCHSSSHLVNGCDTSNRCSVLHTECLHQAKQPHQPRASSWAAAHVGSPAPRSTGLGILSYLCDWPYSGWFCSSSFLFFLICDIIKASEKFFGTCCSALAKTDPRKTDLRAKERTNKDQGGNSPWTF